MDGLLALALIFGVPIMGTLFLSREARLYRERHLAKIQEDRENS